MECVSGDVYIYISYLHIVYVQYTASRHSRWNKPVFFASRNRLLAQRACGLHSQFAAMPVYVDKQHCALNMSQHLLAQGLPCSLAHTADQNAVPNISGTRTADRVDQRHLECRGGVSSHFPFTEKVRNKPELQARSGCKWAIWVKMQCVTRNSQIHTAKMSRNHLMHVDECPEQPHTFAKVCNLSFSFCG